MQEREISPGSGDSGAGETMTSRADRLYEVERIARLGSYEFNLASQRWKSSAVLDEILGIDPATFMHDFAGWLSLVHPDERTGMQDYVTRDVFGAGRPFDREYRIVRKSDGVVRWVHGRGEMLPEADPAFARLVGTIQDITERKLAEQAMQAANQRLAAMFEDARDAIILADVETGVVLDVNKEASNLFNRGKDAMIGLPHTALHPPEMAETARQAFLSQARALQETPTELDILTADGRRIPVEISASIVVLPDGRRALQGMFRDVSSRRRTEAELREREARLSSLFRAVPVGLSVLIDRRFIEVNPHMTDITGYATEELIGKSTRLLYANDEEFERVGRDFYRDIAAGGAATIETTWRHRHGRRLDIFISAAEVRPGDPGAGATFAVIDLTERRRLELQVPTCAENGGGGPARRWCRSRF